MIDTTTPAASHHVDAWSPRPCCRSWTRVPHRKPVTAPKAPTSAASRNRSAAYGAPPRPDEERVGDAPGQARAGADLGDLGRLAGAAGATDAQPLGRLVVTPSSGAGVRRHRSRRRGSPRAGRRNGPSLGAEHARAARPARRDRPRAPRPGRRGRWWTAGGRRAARCAREQPVGGADHQRLGERVHPCGGLVEDDDLDVADEQPREGDELLLARRQRGAAGTEHGVDAVGQPGDPGVEAELLDRGHDPVAGHVGEQGDVVGQGAGEDLGALGDHADRRAQQLEVEVEHVDAADEQRAGLGVDRPRDERGQRRLAGARCGRPGRSVWPAGTDRSTSRSAKVPSS